MGITSHNKRRREAAAEGRPGFLQAAEMHYNNALKRCEELSAGLDTAEQHLSRCEHNLDVARQQAFDQLPAETKAMLKKQAGKQSPDEGQEVAGEAPLTIDDFTAKELKGIARDMGLKLSGNKTALWERIEARKAEIEAGE